MNANFSIPQGEPPKVDLDLGVENKSMGRRIRQRILEGEYSPDSRAEIEMLRAFKESSLSVSKFMKKFYPLILTICLTGCHSTQWKHEPKNEDCSLICN